MIQPTDAPDRVRGWQREFESELARRLQADPDTPPVLLQAMRYAALAGGKHMRPLLVYAAADALDVDTSAVHAIACAVECIHAYSLIHDDLPAMDDDDLRRGRPTCHRRFDEATAILAGDALQALAFEILAADERLSGNPAAQVGIIRSIAHACGASGMAGGQVLDLAAVDRDISYAELEAMHRLKTGALIRVCATAPAILAGADENLCGRLDNYGTRVGLAFQIHDDVLDATASSHVTGKPARADAARNKPAFPSMIGVADSRRRAGELVEAALGELDGFPGETDVLAWLAAYAISRDS